MSIFKNEPEDFMIRVRPQLNNNDDWTGEIDVVIITSPENPTCDDDYYEVMHICKMIASIIPLMEKDNKLRNLVNDYVVNILDKEVINDITNLPTVEKIEDNVVRINFKPETKH
tara:strand:- start:530 stop:871 length:342 start_codon:yes stop_codon:yes gene_type:complete